MNKWTERTIFVNIIFILLYVVVDYATWSRKPLPFIVFLIALITNALLISKSQQTTHS